MRISKLRALVRVSLRSVFFYFSSIFLTHSACRPQFFFCCSCRRYGGYAVTVTAVMAVVSGSLSDRASVAEAGLRAVAKLAASVDNRKLLGKAGACQGERNLHCFICYVGFTVCYQLFMARVVFIL